MQKRIHFLKEIEIKNVSKWDSAKAKDFVSNKVTASQVLDLSQLSKKDGEAQTQQDLSINEEVKIIEYAPSVFQTVKFMDEVTSEQIR